MEAYIGARKRTRTDLSDGELVQRVFEVDIKHQKTLAKSIFSSHQTSRQSISNKLPSVQFPSVQFPSVQIPSIDEIQQQFKAMLISIEQNESNTQRLTIRVQDLEDLVRKKDLEIQELKKQFKSDLLQKRKHLEIDEFSKMKKFNDDDDGPSYIS